MYQPLASKGLRVKVLYREGTCSHGALRIWLTLLALTTLYHHGLLIWPRRPQDFKFFQGANHILLIFGSIVLAQCLEKSEISVNDYLINKVVFDIADYIFLFKYFLLCDILDTAFSWLLFYTYWLLFFRHPTFHTNCFVDFPDLWP